MFCTFFMLIITESLQNVTVFLIKEPISGLRINDWLSKIVGQVHVTSSAFLSQFFRLITPVSLIEASALSCSGGRLEWPSIVEYLSCGGKAVKCNTVVVVLCVAFHVSRQQLP